MSLRRSTAGRAAGLILLVGLGLALGAEAAVRFQPAHPPLADDTGALVEVRVDERIFTLFAALNAAGYDRQGFEEAYHPARQITRAYLAERRLPSLTRLRWRLNVAQPYSDVVWCLHFGEAPQFKRAVAGWHLPALPALLFFGLDDAVRAFYREADLGSVWAQVQPYYQAEAEALRAAAPPALQSTLDYLRLRTLPIDRIVIIPNLLDAHWSGYGPEIGGVGYVIVGPTRQPPSLDLVQHEALHSLLGPLVNADAGSVDRAQAERLQTALRPGLTGSYGTWESLLEESAVRAVGVRLTEPEWRANALLNDEAQGLGLVRPLAEALAAYEAQAGSIEDYLPQWLAVLNELDPASLGLTAPE